MKIIISEIPQEGIDIETEEELKVEGLRLSSPARFKLRVERSMAEVFIKGTIGATLELTCGRCLKDFSRDVETPIDVVYHPATELKAEEHELHIEELETGFYKGDEIDLDELFREQMLLGIPIKPLCKEACKGICPKCGADLNEAGCICPTTKIEAEAEEPLTEKLKKLKEHFERRKDNG